MTSDLKQKGKQILILGAWQDRKKKSFLDRYQGYAVGVKTQGATDSTSGGTFQKRAEVIEIKFSQLDASQICVFHLPEFSSQPTHF